MDCRRSLCVNRPMSNFLPCWPTSCLSKSNWHDWGMTPFCPKSEECSLNARALMTSYFKLYLIQLKCLFFYMSSLQRAFKMWFFFCCLLLPNMHQNLLIKWSCSDVRSRVLACGVVEDSTRCAGCRAVEQTGWTWPLFASSHLPAACVEQSIEEEQEACWSEGWRWNCDIFVLERPRF